MLVFPRFYVTNSIFERNRPNRNGTVVTQNKVFGSIKDSLINLLILVTTSNNPDVMIQIYSQSRLAALYFIVYVLIGIFVFFNLQFECNAQPILTENNRVLAKINKQF